MDAALLSLIGFAVAMYITPGPNNVMVAASSATHGLRATVPHMCGIAAGFALMLVLVSAGLGAVLLSWPPLLPIMRWVGAAWIALIAWQIATAPPPSASGAKPLLGFFGATLFQWVNPKAWLIGLGVASAFLHEGVPLAGQVARIGLVFLLVGLPCILPWALLGASAGRLLHAPARLRAFNTTMALLLVASLIPVLSP